MTSPLEILIYADNGNPERLVCVALPILTSRANARIQSY
jgi:hypothetical protein